MNKPAWDAKPKIMSRWVNWVLDEMSSDDLIAHLARVNAEDAVENHRAWLRNLGPEIAAAEHGNIAPLRARLLAVLRKARITADAAERVVNLLQVPSTGGRGKHRPKDRKLDLVTEAVADVKRIRALWRERYGLRNRSRNLISAVDIAAVRWGVSDTQINNRMSRGKS